MHPLLAEHTPEQAQLLTTILEGRWKLNPPNYTLGVEPSDGRQLWPNFQYVERMLYRQYKLNAREVLPPIRCCVVSAAITAGCGPSTHSETRALSA